MIQSPENYALVEIEKKFQDEQGGILVDTTWLPEEHATLEGTVITAPIRTASDLHRKIIGNIEPGDHIVFSYGVVYDFAAQPDQDTPVYRNLVTYNGKEYWRVHVAEIFCTVREGKIQMVTDNVLVEPFEKMPQEAEGLFLPDADNDTGKVIGAPPGLDFKVNDLVCFEQKFVQEYNILGKRIYVMPSRRVLAKLNQCF